MPYYVVNARTARGAITSGTHIMVSGSPTTPGIVSDQVANFLWFGRTIKHTLCGREAGRYVDVFAPAEAGCGECRRRWELAVKAEAAKTPGQRQREAERRKNERVLQAIAVAVLLGVFLILYAAHVLP